MSRRGSKRVRERERERESVLDPFQYLFDGIECVLRIFPVAGRGSRLVVRFSGSRLVVRFSGSRLVVRCSGSGLGLGSGKGFSGTELSLGSVGLGSAVQG